jgi:hypothetical protein
MQEFEKGQKKKIPKKKAKKPQNGKSSSQSVPIENCIN